MFNGRDLAGWSGDPRLWKVENGVVIGESDQAERKIAANTFLIWKGGEPADFELEYKARVTGNNSGVQYRSKVIDAAAWSVGGYQMDLHPQPNYLGMLYEERGRGISCQSGQKVELDAKPKVTGKFDRPTVNLAEWNEFRIVVRGNVLQHFVNGKQVVEVVDVEPAKRALKGVIALQLHAGPPMKAEFKEMKIRVLEGTAKPQAGLAPKPPAKAPPPAVRWIWPNKQPAANERAFLRGGFTLPPGEVADASLTATCDNQMRLLLNGQQCAASDHWGAPETVDVGKRLIAGARNVLAAELRNDGGPAGFALLLTVNMKDGSIRHFTSDQTWRGTGSPAAGWEQVNFDDAVWQAVTVVGVMGDDPWGNIIESGAGAPATPLDMTDRVQIVKDFRLERLYQVPKSQGSWVAMTVDGKGKLLCADQYGKIHRVTPAAEADSETSAEPLDLPVSGAHGLLWHSGALYVTVAENGGQAGVWRISDSNGDGEPDKADRLKPLRGGGEHGPHALVASPDGQWIYLVAGNHTDLAEVDSSLVPRVWQEDQLLPRRPDARGHAVGRMAPGGWIARFRPDGSNWQLVSIGYRNAYDAAFHHGGELFTYDADMEWDLGMPWYRPTRICHVLPGSEFGWRNGTGKWPDYYEDSMPSQLDLGPGSPTGMLSGVGAKFPQKYQRALFAFDWTYATVRAIHLTPEGRGYRAEAEEFLAGTGLPLTDAVIGADGAMYFLTGGRRIASALWRVRYTGTEAVDPVPQESKPFELGSLDGAWERLSSTDRVARQEARLALENAGPAVIAPKLAAETDPWRSIGAAMALARTGDAPARATVLAALGRLDWAKLDTAQRINWLRACGLAFARHGEPGEPERAAVLSKIDRAFPSNQASLDRELCRMLCYLQAPGIVGRTLAVMDTAGLDPAPDWLAVAKRNPGYGSAVENMIRNLPPAQVIHYVYCLRVVKGPWKREERQRFFAWFERLEKHSGGASYGGFLRDLRAQTLLTCTPEEAEWIAKLPREATTHPLANLPPVQGPGRQWTVDEVETLAASGLAGRNRENGRKMFQAGLCVACHRFGNEGGSVGPDLTTLGGRFTARDLAEAILEPAKVISDQYAWESIRLDDGSEVFGKRLEERDGKWVIATSPFDFSVTTTVERAKVAEIKTSPVSPMPGGLIHRLNPEELKDLLAYLLGK